MCKHVNIVAKVKKLCVKTSVAIGAGSLILMVLFLVMEVFMRLAFKQSTMIAQDFSGYMLGIAFVWGSLKAFDDGQFIRVDVFYEKYKGKAKKVMDLIFCTILTLFLCNITYYFGELVQKTVKLNMKALNIYETPLIYPRAVLLIGLILFVIYMICHIIEVIKMPAEGNAVGEASET